MALILGVCRLSFGEDIPWPVNARLGSRPHRVSLVSVGRRFGNKVFKRVSFDIGQSTEGVGLLVHEELIWLLEPS